MVLFFQNAPLPNGYLFLLVPNNSRVNYNPVGMAAEPATTFSIERKDHHHAREKSGHLLKNLIKNSPPMSQLTSSKAENALHFWLKI